MWQLEKNLFDFLIFQGTLKALCLDKDDPISKEINEAQNARA